MSESKKSQNKWIIIGIIAFLAIFITPVVLLALWTIASIFFSIIG